MSRCRSRSPRAGSSAPPGDEVRCGCWRCSARGRAAVLRAVGERPAAPGVVRAERGTRTRKDPYFLYAASNIGSFAALLLYPVAIEPSAEVEGADRGSGRAGSLRSRRRSGQPGGRCCEVRGCCDGRRDCRRGQLEAAAELGLYCVCAVGLAVVAGHAHLWTDVAGGSVARGAAAALFLLIFCSASSVKADGASGAVAADSGGGDRR